MKPGNSVEEKTLTTGKQREGRALRRQAVHLGKTRTAGVRQAVVGSHGRKARVTPTGSRLSGWTQGPAIEKGQRAPHEHRSGKAAEVTSCPAPADLPTIPGHPRRQKVTEEANCKLKE